MNADTLPAAGSSLAALARKECKAVAKALANRKDRHRGIHEARKALRRLRSLLALVSLTAVFSVSVGLMNLLPVPMLDGGHLLFYLAEALRGRPLPQRAQEYGFRAGLAFLACLFVFATWNDLTHLGLFRWVAGLIG